MERTIGGTLVRLFLGDITGVDCDVIVNAANSSLMGGGGVDGAIHSVGGPEILEECRKIRMTSYPRGLPTGEAVATGGGRLKARYVIHTVGPVWKGGGNGEGELLAKAYANCLDLAESLGVKTLAFPSISTGAYGYPIEKACNVALRSLVDFLLKGDRGLREVIFVLFSQDDYQAYERALADTKMPAM